MSKYRNRPPAGSASAPGCDCGAPPVHPLLQVEHHRTECAFLEASRARREADLAVLAGRPADWGHLRPVDTTEIAEVADAVGEPIPTGRRARRRWTVEVRAEYGPDGTVQLIRTVRRDGRAVAAILDVSPAPAGVAR